MYFASQRAQQATKSWLMTNIDTRATVAQFKKSFSDQTESSSKHTFFIQIEKKTPIVYYRLIIRRNVLYLNWNQNVG